MAATSWMTTLMRRFVVGGVLARSLVLFIELT